MGIDNSFHVVPIYNKPVPGCEKIPDYSYITLATYSQNQTGLFNAGLPKSS
jgi:hypothetical protein